jgi:kumamolisin
MYPLKRPYYRTRPPQFRIADRVSQSYFPDQVAALYGVPSDVDCTGRTIYLLELGGNFNQGWINSFYSTQGRAAPQVSFKSILGETNNPNDTTDGANTEVMLDIVCAAVARGMKPVVAKGPNSDDGFVAILDAALADPEKPDVSISWGQAENQWDSTGRDRVNAVLQALAANGQNVHVASGDNGSGDGAPGNNMDFPGSSPWVIMWGATSLVSSGGTIQSEVVWNDGSAGGATGGGVSSIYPKPSYQAGLVLSGRGGPDMAANGDPVTGYLVPVNGGTQIVGGTSASAPIGAGMLTILSVQLGRPIGFFNPLAYSATVSPAFRDITSGNNGTYIAKTGWDSCTGWGSWNYPRLLAALKNGTLPSPPPPPPPPTGTVWAQTRADALTKVNAAFRAVEGRNPSSYWQQVLESVRKAVDNNLPN